MTDYEKYKGLMLQEAEKIQDKGILSFVHLALNAADPRFFLDPSSSSGKYHPPEDQGLGGAVRHTVKAAEIAYELSRMYMLSDKGRDMAFAATLLHDICKNGNPWTDKTNYEHGLIGYNFLSQFDLVQPEKEMIMNAVRYHMGQWVQPVSELGGAINASKLEQVVQIADYIASRKCASYLPGIDLTQETIENYADRMLKK